MSLKVSVIVLAWNGARFLDACLTALLSQDVEPFQVIVVDNASTDESVSIATRYAPRVQIVRNDYNLGFAGGNNVGIQQADGEILVLLNQDTVVQSGWLRAVIETFGDPTIGIVGCKALYPGGRNLQHAGALIFTDDALTRHIGWGEVDTGQYDTLVDCDYVTGAAMAIGRKVWEKLGGLDEGFYPAFYEEIDYCYRARRAGLRVVYQPRAVLYHHETTSLPAESYERMSAFHRNRVRFVLRNWNAQALETFAAAERQAVSAMMDQQEVIARARAYWDNMLALPAIVFQRQQDTTLGGPYTRGQVMWLLETLQALRKHAHQCAYRLMAEPGQEPITISSEEPATPSALDVPDTRGVSEEANWTSLQDQLENLENNSALREPFLSSTVPWVGRFIDQFRRALTVLVIRHYIVPILGQQSTQNAQVSKVLAEMNRSLIKTHQSLTEMNQSLIKTHRSLTEMNQSLIMANRSFVQEIRSTQSRIQSLEWKMEAARRQNEALYHLQELLRADESAVSNMLWQFFDHFESQHVGEKKNS